MKICYLPTDFEAIGSYRLIYPLEQLQNRGLVEAEHFPIKTTETLEDGAKRIVFDVSEPPDADLYVLQRPYQNLHLWLIEQLQKRAPVVVELDDNYLVMGPENPAWADGHPNWRVRARAANIDKTRITGDEVRRHAVSAKVSGRDFLHRCMTKADAITVSTRHLADTYRRLNRNVFVLPNYVRWADWERVTPMDPSVRFRVGYLGTATWHASDVQILRGLLDQWLERHPQALFVAAGDGNIHDIIGIPENQRVTLDRRVFPAHAEITSQMHVGLVPLQDTGFNQSKSWLKGLEYNAAGVPFIASATQEYERLVAQGALGIAVRKPRQWLAALDIAYAEWEQGKLTQWEPGTGLPQQKARVFAHRLRIERAEHTDKWWHVYNTVTQNDPTGRVYPLAA